jgi:ATP-dependent Lon protease
MLDEVDKMSWISRRSVSRSSSVDPEQSFMFVDHYLDVEYDLSQVFLHSTANVCTPFPGASRPDGSAVHGYTEQEKVEIAKQFWSEKLEQAGLTDRT